MVDKPKLVAIIIKEGGSWMSIEMYQELHYVHKFTPPVFAMRFDDGTVIDPIAGWREAMFPLPWEN